MTGMRAAAGEAVITPPAEGTLLIGPLAPSTGVHDDLYARALVIDDGNRQVAVVCLDLLGLDIETVGRLHAMIEERTGIPASHVLINCSHTHSAPLTVPWSVLGRESFQENLSGWLESVLETVAELVCRTVADLRPATLRAGREAVQLGSNRRLPSPDGVLMEPNPDGAVAAWTDVLCVRDEADRPLAVLFSHAAHPVIVHGSSALISADYPGFAAAEVRQQLGEGVVAMFAQGCGANCNAEPLRGGFEAARRAGTRLGHAAAQAATQGQPLPDGPITCLSREVALPFQAPPPAEEIRKILDGNTLAELDLEKSSDEATKRWYDQDAKRCLEQLLAMAERQECPTLPFRIQGFAVGQAFGLVGLSHEPFAEYQLEADRASPLEHTMMLGYTNGIESYIPCDEDLNLGGYETAPVPLPGAPLRYRHRLNLAHGVESRVTEAIGAFLDRLASEARQ